MVDLSRFGVSRCDERAYRLVKAVSQNDRVRFDALGGSIVDWRVIKQHLGHKA